LTIGVGHPEQPLPDVGCARARSAQIGGPDGITQCFQVSAYSGEPSMSSLARNLLSKDDWRIALGDEASKVGPEMTGVRFPLPFAGDREGLAGTAPGPDGSIVGPSRESECMRPPSNACKEVKLGVAREVAGLHRLNVPLIHVAWSNHPGPD
jgi:hypothetical protein